MKYFEGLSNRTAWDRAETASLNAAKALIPASFVFNAASMITNTPSYNEAGIAALITAGVALVGTTVSHALRTKGQAPR